MSVQQTAPQRIWLALSYGAERKYAGNAVYADELEAVYRYDSNVSNHRQLREGDVLLLCDPKVLLGLATIAHIATKSGVKELRRCPECGTTAIKERRLKRPAYRCDQQHEFEAPDITPVQCTNYEAHFDGTFRPSPERVSVEEIRRACPRFNGQLAIQRIDEERLPELARSLLYRLGTPGQASRFVALAAADASDEPYTPDGRDEREVIPRQIRARRGQKAFRDALRKLFNDSCAVTRCRLVDLLEAAHIHPYRGPRDNHPSNGLLLRADIHTLFDLNLLGIEPETLKVHLHAQARGMGYDQFEGVVLACHPGALSKPALSTRWLEFQRVLANRITSS